MSSREIVKTSMSWVTAPRLTSHSVKSSRVRNSRSFTSALAEGMTERFESPMGVVGVLMGISGAWR